MFFFRLNKLKIIDNREERNIFQLFGPDRAEVQLSSFITTDSTDLPEVGELLATDNLQRRRKLAELSVARVINSRVLMTIENVTDNHEMTFGDTGYVLYQADRIPEQFDWILLALESDQDQRDMGVEMNTVLQNDEFHATLDNTLALAATAANPSYTVAVSIGKLVTKMLAQQCRKNDDDMIGVLYTSLNRREHYPHGERKKDNVADLTNNMFVDYSLFGFDPQPQPALMQRLPPISVTGGIQPRRRFGA
ncbi:MAG: hypothetical protein H6822_34995 [Planctomycetaceae bacterium]|nr:hypothetical protein [Planctomycetales bacterium]MCB9927394.1 hypothetical protein [Planctomycetaceae bacterium]